MTNEMHIRVSLASQELVLQDESGQRLIYPVSTALKGAGERINSECTPRGWHRVRCIIGQGCPANAVFTGRRVGQLEGRPGKLHVGELVGRVRVKVVGDVRGDIGGIGGDARRVRGYIRRVGRDIRSIVRNVGSVRGDVRSVCGNVGGVRGDVGRVGRNVRTVVNDRESVG